MIEANTRKSHLYNNEEEPPRGAVPYFDSYTGDSDNLGIMSLRWEGGQLVEQLWKGLANMKVETYGNKTFLVPIYGDATFPPINHRGAAAIINMVESVVNPVVSLSKISEDKANVLTAHIKSNMRHMVIMNEEEYEIFTTSSKEYVLQIVENIVYAQLMRAVNGHESQHSRTNLMEHREEGSYTQQSRGGFELPWKKKKQEGF